MREKQIRNTKTIKTDNIFTWFTNLATSTAEGENILLCEENQITERMETNPAFKT